MDVGGALNVAENNCAAATIIWRGSFKSAIKGDLLNGVTIAPDLSGKMKKFRVSVTIF